MSNETMTDARALDFIRVYLAPYRAHGEKDQVVEHIAARLRGEAVQPADAGDAVRADIETALQELDSITATDDQSDGIGCAEIALRRALHALSAAPAAPAPVAGDAVDGWQYLAADWLEQQAEEQEEANAKYPQHAAAYKAWRDRPLELRMLAEKVKKAEGTLKRHCPPPSWMFPDDGGAVSKLPESWEGMAQDLRASVGGTHKAIAREECARELRAALAQDRAAQAGAAGGVLSANWRPIESAPDDVRIICAWLGAPGCSEVDVACRFTDHNEGAPYWCSPTDRWDRYGVPDLWQPFPTISDDALTALLAAAPTPAAEREVGNG